MASAAWGIDIGNRALKAVKLQRTAEGVKMTDFAAIEHDTILSEAGDNREELLQTSLAKFVSRHDTRKTAVAVSVTGQQSFARFVKLPPVEPKKIPEIVRFEAVQQIPFPLDDVEWSYQLFEREDDPDVEVGIFAMRKELVNAHVQTFVNAELDVLAVQTNPLAVYNAVRNDGRLDKGHAVILDLGAESTDMIVADNDSIWMRSLDVGGNAFTEALAKAFKIDFEKAEEMKRGAKASKYAKQIYQAMRPVFGELVGEVQRSLGFYQSGHKDAEVRKIIALGGGFKLNGLSGYLQKNLQMPVEKPQRYVVPGPDDAGAAAALAENTLSGTCAYGLALQALGDAAITSSLLPTHIRQDKMWRDKTKYFVAAGVMGIAAAMIALASLLLNDGALARGTNAQNQIQQIKTTATSLASQWDEVSADGGAELQIVRNVNTLREGVSYWPGLAADLWPPCRVRQATRPRRWPGSSATRRPTTRPTRPSWPPRRGPAGRTCGCTRCRASTPTTSARSSTTAATSTRTPARSWAAAGPAPPPRPTGRTSAARWVSATRASRGAGSSSASCSSRPPASRGGRRSSRSSATMARSRCKSGCTRSCRRRRRRTCRTPSCWPA